MDRSNVVGIDVGKTEHYAVGLDASGAKLLAQPLPNEQAAIDDLVAWVTRSAARVVVDQPTGGAGPLVAACWEAGVPIGYLHGLAMARARDFYEGEAKTDPKDAFVIADVARAHPSRSVELRPVPEERATLELLCGADEDLRGDVNRATNRLRQLLTTHWPALERLLGAGTPFEPGDLPAARRSSGTRPAASGRPRPYQEVPQDPPDPQSRRPRREDPRRARRPAHHRARLDGSPAARRDPRRGLGPPACPTRRDRQGDRAEKVGPRGVAKPTRAQRRERTWFHRAIRRHAGGAGAATSASLYRPFGVAPTPPDSD